MFAPNGHTYDSDLLAALSQRVSVGDGAMDTQLQATDLTPDDFRGVCPNLEDRAKTIGLLEAERIGVTLSEEFQLHPKQSTDAFVPHHPEAKCFNT